MERPWPLGQIRSWEGPGPPCAIQVLEWKQKSLGGYAQAGGPDVSSQSSQEQRKASVCPRIFPQPGEVWTQQHASDRHRSVV